MSLINDALKKAQEKRAQDAAAQTPAAPPARAPAPDTISKPLPEDTGKKIPPPPPPPNRPQLPIPPPRASTTPRPPIVNYSIPQIDPAEQPATPNNSRPRRSSSIRYDSSIYEEPERSRSSGTQKKFWLIIGGIALAAVLVRIIATFGQGDDTSARRQAEPTQPPQSAISLPAPSLPPPVLPTRRTEEPAPPAAQPETPVADEPAVTASEPPPAISFPAKPVATTKPAPAPATTPTPVAAAPAPAAPPTVSMPATAAQPQPSPSAIPSIYAPRAPAPVTNATRTQNFIDRLRVTSVRISDRGSKVILNDRMFSVGELVDPGLELRLVKIEQGVITFSDPEGKKYVKLYQ